MIDLPMAPLVPSEPIAGDEQQLVLGFGYVHRQAHLVAQQVFQSATEISAVAKALEARGLLTEEELAPLREAEAERLNTLFRAQHVGVELDTRVPDKYAIPADSLPQIDCENRYHLCHAACCAMDFWLSPQDLDEGVVRFTYGRPYLIRQGADGYCAHLDRGANRCSVYQHRPSVCRTYDCRKDTRIWLDFEKSIINPELISFTPDGTRIVKFTTPQGEEGAAASDQMSASAPPTAGQP